MYNLSQPKKNLVLRPHNFSGKIVGYSYCVRCGLVHYRNRATEKAIAKGCYENVDVKKG